MRRPGIEMRIMAFFEPPKSASKVKRVQMIYGLIHPIKKPDADNIAKIIADSLNHLAYRDDSQIVEMAVQKRYAETPYVYVQIRSIG